MSYAEGLRGELRKAAMRLANQYYKLKREVLRKAGEPSPKILILVNGVEVTGFGELERIRVGAGDEIVLIPIIHGG